MKHLRAQGRNGIAGIYCAEHVINLLLSVFLLKVVDKDVLRLGSYEITVCEEGLIVNDSMLVNVVNLHPLPKPTYVSFEGS